MKLETVSRTFSAFQQQRLLEVDKRHIRITDLDGLTRTSRPGFIERKGKKSPQSGHQDLRKALSNHSGSRPRSNLAGEVTDGQRQRCSQPDGVAGVGDGVAGHHAADAGGLQACQRFGVKQRVNGHANRRGKPGLRQRRQQRRPVSGRWTRCHPAAPVCGRARTGLGQPDRYLAVAAPGFGHDGPGRTGEPCDFANPLRAFTVRADQQGLRQLAPASAPPVVRAATTVVGMV